MGGYAATCAAAPPLYPEQVPVRRIGSDATTMPVHDLLRILVSFSSPYGDAARSRPAQEAPSGADSPPVAVTALVLGALVVVLLIASEVWTKYLWFDQLDYTEVLATRWITQGGILFVLGFLLFAAPLYVSLRIAYSRRPVYPPVTREQEALEQFRSAVDPLRKGLTVAAPLIIGAFGGLAASRTWQDVQLFLHPPRTTARSTPCSGSTSASTSSRCR